MNLEMRWLITDGRPRPEKILQYRFERETPDYCILNPSTGEITKQNELTDWITVPTVDGVYNANL